jgi:hypothetical protein
VALNNKSDFLFIQFKRVKLGVREHAYFDNSHEIPSKRFLGVTMAPVAFHRHPILVIFYNFNETLS